MGLNTLDKKYNLEWHVGTTKKETLLRNVDFALAMHVKEVNTRQKNYTMGRLKITTNS